VHLVLIGPKYALINKVHILHCNIAFRTKDNYLFSDVIGDRKNSRHVKISNPLALSDLY